jgi:hypothetical protein
MAARTVNIPAALADVVGVRVIVETLGSGRIAGRVTGWSRGGYHAVVTLDNGRHFMWSDASLVNDYDDVRQTILDHSPIALDDDER